MNREKPYNSFCLTILSQNQQQQQHQQNRTGNSYLKIDKVKEEFAVLVAWIVLKSI